MKDLAKILKGVFQQEKTKIFSIEKVPVGFILKNQPSWSHHCHCPWSSVTRDMSCKNLRSDEMKVSGIEAGFL